MRRSIFPIIELGRDISMSDISVKFREDSVKTLACIVFTNKTKKQRKDTAENNTFRISPVGNKLKARPHGSDFCLRSRWRRR